MRIAIISRRPSRGLPPAELAANPVFVRKFTQVRHRFWRRVQSVVPGHAPAEFDHGKSDYWFQRRWRVCTDHYC